MEQFSPGEETAWKAIRNWIDQSDAFILILGGRYGSIEPRSGKGYVELEYEYAVERGKPLFSVVIKETHHEQRIKHLGLAVDERAYPDKYVRFRRIVMERVCADWSDVKDIQIAILRKLPQWAQDPDLVGWVRDEGRPAPAVLNEMARLSQENSELRSRLAALSEKYDGLTFEQLASAMVEARFDKPPEGDLKALLDYFSDGVKRIISQVIDAEPRNAGDLFEGLHEVLSSGLPVPIKTSSSPHTKMEAVLRDLFSHGLITSHRVEPVLARRHVYKDSGFGEEEQLDYDPGTATYRLTDLGRRFRNRMLLVGDREERRRRLWSTESAADMGTGSSA
jgi:hypothetical protein